MKAVLNADPSFDVWSLGTVMFELVVGRPLFPGVDARENLDARVRALYCPLQLWPRCWVWTWVCCTSQHKNTTSPSTDNTIICIMHMDDRGPKFAWARIEATDGGVHCQAALYCEEGAHTQPPPSQLLRPGRRGLVRHADDPRESVT